MLIKYLIAFIFLCRVSSNVVLKKGGNYYETTNTIFNNIKEEGWIDWRDKNAVSPAKDQKNCKICWAFSVIATIESHLKIHTNLQTELSVQFLLDCDPRQLNCNQSASLLDTYSNIVNVFNGVLVQSDYYNYDGQYHGCRCDNTKNLKKYKDNSGNGTKDVQDPVSKLLGRKYSDDLPLYYPDGGLFPTNFPCTRKVVVTGYKRVKPDEREMLKFLISQGPLTAGINSKAMAEYKGNPKNNYIDEPTDEQCPPTDLNHAVEIVGFNIFVSGDKKVRYWIIKNSWGEDWGDKGFYYLVAGRNACGISRDVSIPYVN